VEYLNENRILTHARKMTAFRFHEKVFVHKGWC